MLFFFVLFDPVLLLFDSTFFHKIFWFTSSRCIVRIAISCFCVCVCGGGFSLCSCTFHLSLFVEPHSLLVLLISFPIPILYLCSNTFEVYLFYYWPVLPLQNCWFRWCSMGIISISFYFSDFYLHFFPLSDGNLVFCSLIILILNFIYASSSCVNIPIFLGSVMIYFKNVLAKHFV